eukprot:CAMPEP_0174759240 /NCGR_PEP_ID=MMETSP1094-20130205/108169_1 /TAXON_ID=156173 /ORGANISM="Chrysochromulina brevifilum, Strain UTEX LB 985" /LENGTH=40 /DNA_ID= /DNA_START= /DNA_END= /DNA_ORIENTATION=
MPQRAQRVALNALLRCPTKEDDEDVGTVARKEAVGHPVAA